MSGFKFNLGDDVKLVASEEQGTVIGRSEFNNGSCPSYLVRYKAGDGRQNEVWWTGDALEAITAQ